jgi:TolB-like protein
MRKLKMLGIYIIAVVVVFYAVTGSKPELPKKPAAPVQKITRRNLPQEKPYDFPSDYLNVHKALAGSFSEVSAFFTNGNVPVLIITPFTITQSNNSPLVLTYLTESAYDYLHKSRNLRAIKRDYTSNKKPRITSNYILVGKVSPIGNQVRITLRIEDIRTGEIIDAFDDYVDKQAVARYL